MRFQSEGQAASYLIGFGSTAAEARHAGDALNQMLRVIETCRAETLQASPTSTQNAVEGVHNRVAALIEEAEQHVNRLRKDIETVKSGAVHRIFFEMVRALRMCRAIVVGGASRRERPSYAGIVRLRQHIAEVLDAVRKAAQHADAAIHEQR